MTIRPELGYVALTDSLKLAREREAKARELLHEASENPAADACDDAWMTAAIFQTLLDAERLNHAIDKAVKKKRKKGKK
jgi:benzoyl-CoA reductase/2-hydroxyglutaryl-CoA dehydratase subunit BcrC/BadD/HgdB